MTELRSPALRTVVMSALVVIVVGLTRTVAGAELAAGDRAPDFSLPSTTGEPISPSRFRAKKAVLLEFHGADFAPQ